MLQQVDFSQATDAELQIAAKFAGLDEMGLGNVIESEFLNQRARDRLINGLTGCGYRKIQIDPDNRVTNGYALTPFEVALPVE